MRRVVPSCDWGRVVLVQRGPVDCMEASPMVSRLRVGIQPVVDIGIPIHLGIHHGTLIRVVHHDSRCQLSRWERHHIQAVGSRSRHAVNSIRQLLHLEHRLLRQGIRLAVHHIRWCFRLIVRSEVRSLAQHFLPKQTQLDLVTDRSAVVLR